MIYVLLSVVCSVLVSVLLKLARRFDIDVGQAIAWNYAVASALTALLLQPSLAILRAPGAPWLALAGLGILLPTIFLALAASVRHAGIVRSDAAQRLSLLLSLLAAFVLFGEQLTAFKSLGIALGLLALLCMVWNSTDRYLGKPDAASFPRKRESIAILRNSSMDDQLALLKSTSRFRGNDEQTNGYLRFPNEWLYPLLVFAGFAAIDILFKRVALAGVPLGTSLQVMFALALPVAFALQLWRRAQNPTRSFTTRGALAGVLLGLANFGNILFYLRGHRALPQHPALVFASMNIGVVALGALVGLLLFRERLSRLNLVGVALALLAIAVIAWR
jgi:drug/metabolite transporter (DMT)-like permease